jgi:hypothetical protein
MHNERKVLNFFYSIAFHLLPLNTSRDYDKRETDDEYLLVYVSCNEVYNYEHEDKVRKRKTIGNLLANINYQVDFYVISKGQSSQANDISHTIFCGNFPLTFDSYIVWFSCGANN